MAKSKRKAAYALWNAHKVGVFTSWEDVKLLVDGFPDARYQGFNSVADAQAAFDAHYQSIQEEIAKKNKNKRSKRTSIYYGGSETKLFKE
ncbi:RNase H1/viroplasmin domain-containing protein [Photobacterium damselae subsp. damselae]|uniref:RNase H1/viroplasmin domain-containing protein n=1 Tax=Photobacterium damselae TaxID=38293 RepID=UPI001F3EBD50|nr:RNase H1/viroplasmin domain-containing protein [Photobacterium damselae]UJZ95011.1 RNase H1/viroplasmin domain-containing protein [Photobacterium damselae subsp. damselae]UJZ98992.1 RNase H1/viroplasmin domain-containing protein [Photobacterium damselae subsp. damselae]